MCRCGALRDDNVHRATDQFGCQVRETLQDVVRGAVLDGDILSLDVARFTKTFAKRVNSVRRQLRGACPEKPDPRDFRWLLRLIVLRPGRERRGEETENDREPDQSHGATRSPPSRPDARVETA